MERGRGNGVNSGEEIHPASGGEKPAATEATHQGTIWPTQKNARWIRLEPTPERSNLRTGIVLEELLFLIVSLLEKAIEIAVQAHKGQKDRAGSPYILHPLNVMCRMETEEEKIAAVLHDVIEDTEVTLDGLRLNGFSPEIVAAIDTLTRRQGEAYDHYIERVRPHPLARRVKLEDLRDNMDLRRSGDASPEDVGRFQRYQRAWRRLVSENTAGVPGK